MVTFPSITFPTFPGIVDVGTEEPPTTGGTSTAFGGSISSFFTLTSSVDTFDGTSGVDVLLARNLSTSNLRVDNQGNGGFQLFNLSAGDTLTATVSGIERIELQNGNLALDVDLSGNAGTVYRVYQAAFDRTPDQGGFSYWLKEHDVGMSLLSIAQGFVGSAEFKEAYGTDLNSSAVVGQFYRNVLGREGEQEGVAFWTGRLDGGDSVANVLTQFAQSPENIARVSPAIEDGIAFV